MSQASKIAALALAGAVTFGTVAATNAAPVTADTSALKAATASTSPVENVYYRRGFGAGPFVAGAILGGAALGLATGGFGYGGGYGYAPAYYPAYGYGYARPYYRSYYRPHYRPYSYYGYAPRRFHRYHGW